MNLQELIAKQQRLLDVAKAENRDLSEEEKAEFDKLQRQIDEVRSSQNSASKATPQSNADNNAQRELIIREERQRIDSINSMCREFNIDEEQTRQFINSGASLDKVREGIIEHLREQHAPAPQGSSLKFGDDGVDKYRSAAVTGLLMRGAVLDQGVSISQTSENKEARGFSRMSLRDLAIDILSRETSEKNLNRKSNDEIFEIAMKRSFYNPTSSFPVIMDQAIEKAYIEGHRTVPVTFDKFTRKGTLTDFKKHDNYYLAGPAAEFLEVPEGGELKASTFEDKHRPQRQLKTYGRQFSMTRQAFINDDVSFVTSLPAKYAKSARKTINKQVYQILMGDSNIYDGKKLFCKEHGNLVTKGTGITAESLRAMILAMNTQTDEFGEATVIRPAYLVVPSGYAFDMYTIFYSPTINTEGNTQAVNPLFQYKDSIQIIEDPTINALSGGFGNIMPWWLIGNKDDTDFIEVDYLNGNEIPSIRRMEQPGVLGFTWDIFLDWGISVMDFRGAIKNPGVKLDSKL
jgi:hypothetical protein|nr:hypothetical protein [Ruminococcus sp. 1001270H_150608_F2]